MALRPNFPTSPYDPLVPDQRWFSADKVLRETAYEKLSRPLVAKIRSVYSWRTSGKRYEGASATSRSLLTRWFETKHQIEAAMGRSQLLAICFAQREAVETVIWLYEAQKSARQIRSNSLRRFRGRIRWKRTADIVSASSRKNCRFRQL